MVLDGCLAGPRRRCINDTIALYFVAPIIINIYWGKKDILFLKNFLDLSLTLRSKIFIINHCIHI